MGIPLWKGPSSPSPRSSASSRIADKTLSPRIARRPVATARSSGTLLEILRRGAPGGLDGLGDRERSLSPDSQWEIMASNVGLATACDEAWDEEEREEEPDDDEQQQQQRDDYEEMRLRLRHRRLMEARAPEDVRRRHMMRAMARTSRGRYERLEPYQDMLDTSRRRFEESMNRVPLTHRVPQGVMAHQSVMAPALQEFLRGREERL